MRLEWWVKWVFSRDLFGFYRMSVLGVMKNCWLCQENIWIFAWWVMYWVLWEICVAERYRLMAWIYLDWDRWVRDFGVIFDVIFEMVMWEVVEIYWDFTIRWSIRLESGGACELVGIYWDRCIFQSVWRLTCLCCWADPGSAPGWKVPPSLIFHDF